VSDRAATVTSTPGWRAALELQFAERAGRTYLARRQHVGPLLVQRPFHPEGSVCHAYLVHPPGGVVGGDELQLQVEVGRGAHALLTTPAATKFYRSAGPLASQAQQLSVADGTLEWLPQETIYYSGARVQTATRLQLTGAARVIAWEIGCLGLPARGEDFTAGELALDFELWRSHTPLLIDRLRIRGEGAVRTARWGLGGYRALGIFVAYPGDAQMLAAVRNVTGVTFTATWVDGVLVCRCVAQQAQDIRRAFTAAWQVLRPALLDRAAVSPRIWST
jgi:urease accessory protein